MPRFHFRVVDRDGVVAGDESYDIATNDEALKQAKTVLAEMALDGLPFEPLRTYLVEVLDSHYRPIYEIRLSIEICSCAAEKDEP